jgi:ABC-type antimicrobial peptide transport system permease subunit
MWRSNLLIAVRLLLRHRVYSAINIGGLALGLAGCLLILGYIRYERSYDSWLPDHERVHQVQTTIRPPGQPVVRDIVRLLAWQFSKPVVLANLLAWPIAWWAMRDWLNTFDARIALTPGPFLLAGLLALGIAVVTVGGHAIRVARTNPIHALRYE